MSTATIDRTARICALNDNLRTTFGGGKVMLSASVTEMGHELKAAALMEMRKFTAFDGGNDPHRGHDFGAFEIGHYRFLFKIDLYEEPDVKNANGEPVVTRVLTIMLAEEY